MGTSSSNSSSTNISNSGKNTNSTSVSQPINPVYNLNVSQTIPASTQTTSGILKNGIINPVSTNSGFSQVIIGGVIVLIILIFILVK
jgi:hypothetical protein